MPRLTWSWPWPFSITEEEASGTHGLNNSPNAIHGWNPRVPGAFLCGFLVRRAPTVCQAGSHSLQSFCKQLWLGGRGPGTPASDSTEALSLGDFTYRTGNGPVGTWGAGGNSLPPWDVGWLEGCGQAAGLAEEGGEPRSAAREPSPPGGSNPGTRARS